MTLPDPAPIRDLIEAFRRSKTMFTAVSMGIFDRLEAAPARAADLAAALGAHPDALERLLDGCAALGLLAKRDGVYANLPVASVYLTTSSPDSLYGYIRYSDEALYPLWRHLEDAVKEGTHRWKQAFGLEGPIFDHFFRTEKAMRDFLRGMHGNGLLTSHKVAAAFDFSRYRRLVDLGGATGHLAIALCERYPGLQGVVFDLPRAAAQAGEYVALSRAADRIEIVPGDFFRDDLPPADLYAAGQILHDWSEDKIDALLRKVFARLPGGGAFLVVEKLLNEDGVGPLGANLQSLNMLVNTEGQERSLSGYTRLLEKAGFPRVAGVRTGAYLDAILAVKE